MSDVAQITHYYGAYKLWGAAMTLQIGPQGVLFAALTCFLLSASPASARPNTLGFLTSQQCTSSGVSLAQCAAKNSASWRQYFANPSHTSATLPEGTFPVETLSISNNLSLFGAGKDSTQLVGYENPVLSVAGVTKRISVTLADFSVDGQSLATAIEYGGGTNSTFRDLKIVNSVWGIKIREATDETTLTRIYIDHPQTGGILIGQFVAGPPTVTQSNIDVFLDTIQIIGDYLPGKNMPKCQFGIALYGGLSGLTARAISEARCGTGIFVDEYPGNTNPLIVPEWLTFDSTFMDTNADIGWHIRKVRGLFLTNAWSGFSGNYGVYIGSGTNISISTTKVYNAGNAGIALDSGVSGASISRSIIGANNHSNVCSSGIYIAAGAKSVVVESNAIISNDPQLGMQTPQYKCGLEVRPGATVTAWSNIITNVDDHKCEPLANYKSICPFDGRVVR